MKKKRPSNALRNRRASFDYQLGDSLVVGMELTGAETKALRKSHGHIKGSYVVVKDGELWLLNATITGDNQVRIPEEGQTRTRKLLAKRRQINALIAEKQRGQSIVPVEILNKGRYIKLKIALGKGKRKIDKRQTIQKRQDDIASRRAIKNLSR